MMRFISGQTKLALVAALAGLTAACGSSSDGSGNGGGGVNPSGFATYQPADSSLGNMPFPNQAWNYSDNLDNLESGDTVSLYQTAMTLTEDSFSVATDVNNEGAKVEAIAFDRGNLSRVQLSIPGMSLEDVGLDYAGSNGNGIQLFSGDFNGQDVALYLSRDTDGYGDLDFTFYGAWLVGNIDAENATGGFLYSGFQTPTDQMPNIGYADYAGQTVGYYVSGDGNTRGTVVGDVGMQVNFGLGTVSGSLYNMSYDRNGSWSDFNQINLAGNIQDDNRSYFRGDAAVDTSVDGPMNDTGGGYFNGAFFGPYADEIGLSWTVQDQDGNTAFGSAGARD